jgi:hypothetical protein
MSGGCSDKCVCHVCRLTEKDAEVSICMDPTCKRAVRALGQQVLHFHKDGSTTSVVTSTNYRDVVQKNVTFEQAPVLAQSKVELMLKLQTAFQLEEERRAAAYAKIIETIHRSLTVDVLLFPKDITDVLQSVLESIGKHTANANGYKVYELKNK